MEFFFTEHEISPELILLGIQSSENSFRPLPSLNLIPEEKMQLDIYDKNSNKFCDNLLINESNELNAFKKSDLSNWTEERVIKDLVDKIEEYKFNSEFVNHINYKINVNDVYQIVKKNIQERVLNSRESSKRRFGDDILEEKNYYRFNENRNINEKQNHNIDKKIKKRSK